MGWRILLKLVSIGDEYTTETMHIPFQLAKRMNLECINIGKKDVSNQTIWLNSLQYITQNSKNIFMLIGWTEADRFDIYWEDKYFTYRRNKNVYPIAKLSSMHVADDYIFNEKVIHGEWIANIINLQETLKAYKIPFYMYNTQDAIRYNDDTANTARCIDLPTYHNPLNRDSSFIHFMKKRNYEIDDKAHHDWARFLHNKILAAKLI